MLSYLLMLLNLLFSEYDADAQYHLQNGYQRNDGTYVQPHYKSDSDNNIYNNINQPSQHQIDQHNQRNSGYQGYNPYNR